MMDDRKRKELIAKYKDGYRLVAEALAGIDEKALDTHPAPGKWSPREIVHHLADSEMTAAVRLRMLLAEERPQIKGYDQDAFAKKLYYDRPYEKSLEAFRFARETTSQILERMDAAAWAREGTHTEHGHYTVEMWLEIYAEHALNHAEQIRRARSVAAER
jgi:hypothetical protein